MRNKYASTALIAIAVALGGNGILPADFMNSSRGKKLKEYQRRGYILKPLAEVKRGKRRARNLELRSRIN